MATNSVPQTVNFGIKGDVAASFLRVNGVEPKTGGATAALTTPQIAAGGKASTAQVTCVRVDGRSESAGIVVLPIQAPRVLGCVHPHEPVMPDSTTLTVRLSADTKAQLAKLAHSTRRTQSFLGAEAIAAYVQRELAIVGAIERGRADVEAGCVTDHADVVRDAHAAIAAVRKAR